VLKALKKMIKYNAICLSHGMVEFFFHLVLNNNHLITRSLIIINCISSLIVLVCLIIGIYCHIQQFFKYIVTTNLRLGKKTWTVLLN